MLNTLKNLVFGLTEENVNVTVHQTMDLFDSNFPCSFNFLLSIIILSSFSTRVDESSIYLRYLQEIQKKQEMLKNSFRIIHIFGIFLSEIMNQEALYLLDKMFEQNLIDIKPLRKKSFYFSHYQGIRILFDSSEGFVLDFCKDRTKLSKNDWELHKKYVKEGVNPNEIAKIIRNDEIEKLQEISSHNNFDYNQTIKPSLYERCSFVNQKNVTLIDYAAFFSSVKCFKYLLMNNASVENTGKYAVAGGNEEIIHLCEQNHSSFEDACEAAIKYHRNDIFKYIYENKLEKLNNHSEQEDPLTGNANQAPNSFNNGNLNPGLNGNGNQHIPLFNSIGLLNRFKDNISSKMNLNFFGIFLY